MANNVIDAAIRLRDLFTPMVRSVNASLGAMKTQMAAAKQSVSGLSDKLTEHERIQKRTAKSIEQTGSKISGLSDKMALLSAPILAAATAGFKLHSDFANGIAKISTLVDTTVVSMQKVSDEIVLSAMRPGRASPTFRNRSTRLSRRVSMPAML